MNYYQIFSELAKSGEVKIKIQFDNEGLPCSAFINGKKVGSSFLVGLITTAGNCIAMNEPKIDTVKSNKKKRTNFIYLMTDEATGNYKIGRSVSPEKRKSCLKSGSPTIKLIAYWQAPVENEDYYHNKYEAKRVHGEWFKLSQDDVDSILSQVKAIYP